MLSSSYTLMSLHRLFGNINFEKLRHRIQNMRTVIDPKLDALLYKEFLLIDYKTLTISDYVCIIEILTMRRGLEPRTTDGVFHMKHICVALESIHADTFFLAWKVLFLLADSLSTSTDMTSMHILRKAIYSMEDTDGNESPIVETSCSLCTPWCFHGEQEFSAIENKGKGKCSLLYDMDGKEGEGFRYACLIYRLLESRLSHEVQCQRKDKIHFRDENMNMYMTEALLTLR